MGEPPRPSPRSQRRRGPAEMGRPSETLACRCLAVILMMLLTCLSMTVECVPLVEPECPSGELTPTGECCLQCPAGWGVQTRCSAANNTVCARCYADITYSAKPSHTAGCRPCTRCARNQLVRHPCNATHDAVCECRRNYFRTADGSCSQCDPCPPGFGAAVGCTARTNSQCQPCANGTFSYVTSATDSCEPCSRCTQGSVVLKACTSFSDTVCSGKLVPTTGTTRMGSLSPDPIAETIDGRSPSIVPIYCAILAFVVIGLLAYVVFKRWSFRKIKLRAHSKANRSPSGPPSQVDCAEKSSAHPQKKSSALFTSMASVDERPSDQVPLMAVSSTTLYRDLPTATRSQVESLLGISRLDRRDWRGVAKELGFTDKDIVHFIKTSEHDLPVHRILTVWSDGEGAVVGLLVAALQRLNRQDVLQKLPLTA